MIQPTHIHFTLLIRINNRLREFNFYRRNEGLYEVDTNDERGNRFFFKMFNEDAVWKMDGQGLPDWILSNAPVVHEALKTKEQGL
jgi:hypothetical protein